MKKTALITLVSTIVLGIAAGLLFTTPNTRAQAPAAQHYECAILKWDGNDRIQLLTPAKSEVIRVYQAGGQKTQDIPEEEYCLTWAANKLAQEGWALVNLNNRRILMHRPASR